MKFIAGNSYKCALNVAKKQLSLGKKPIINYIKEDINNYQTTYNEYIHLLNYIDHNYSIAIKLSSFNFNEYVINTLIEKYKEKNIKIFIDAERSDQNKKYQEISNKLILNHNYNNYNLIKTYQMYRKDSYDQLKYDINLHSKNKVKTGIKMVRGAYWNSEHTNGQLFINKKDTDNNYNNTIKYINNLEAYKVLATHNDISINMACDMKSNFKFAHLLDMNTYKYNSVSKNNDVFIYIPYGPYNSMIPYLFRRLYENIDTIKYMIT